MDIQVPHILPLAQTDYMEDPMQPPPAAPAPRQPARPMNFSDLQGAMRDYSDGKHQDNTFRNGSLIIMGVIAIVALLIHLRQKQKNAEPPDSVGKLGRELGRLVRFPLGTKALLKWVAASRKVPFASLLLSSALFDRCVKEWSCEHTFAVFRAWGKSRLDKLRPVLFETGAGTSA
jgi:hypothetical protein